MQALPQENSQGTRGPVMAQRERDQWKEAFERSCDDTAHLKAALDAERQQHTQLLALVRALVDKLDESDKASQGIFITAAMHGIHYNGPSYADELQALKATLDATAPTIEQEIEQIVEEAGNPVWPKGGDGE